MGSVYTSTLFFTLYNKVKQPKYGEPKNKK